MRTPEHTTLSILKRAGVIPKWKFCHFKVCFQLIFRQTLMYIQWLCSLFQTRRICHRPGFRNNRPKFSDSWQEAPLFSCPFFTLSPRKVKRKVFMCLWAISFSLARGVEPYLAFVFFWQHLHFAHKEPSFEFHRELTNSRRHCIGRQYSYSVSSFGGIVWCSELFIVWQLDGKTISKLCGLIMQPFWVKQ